MPMSHAISYDPQAKAVYVELSDNLITETVQLSESVYVDLDSHGEPVGFEVLDAERCLFAGLPTLPATFRLRDLVDRASGSAH